MAFSLGCRANGSRIHPHGTNSGSLHPLLRAGRGPGGGRGAGLARVKCRDHVKLLARCFGEFSEATTRDSALTRARRVDGPPHMAGAEGGRRSHNAIRVGVTCQARCELVKSSSLSITRHLLLSSLIKEGEAERRQTLITNRRILRCGARSCGARTPVGVPPRLSPKGVSHPKGSASGQASWDVV